MKILIKRCEKRVKLVKKGKNIEKRKKILRRIEKKKKKKRIEKEKKI